MGSGWGVKLDGKIRIIPGGVIEIAKSQGVCELLLSQADKAAQRCNSMACGINSRNAPLYESEIKMLDRTAGARVYVASVEAHMDNRLHNTLKKGCGV